MQTAYSIAFLIGLFGAVVLCIRRPFAGLLVVAGVSPFYSLLRESSVGSPVFFVWPYVLVGVLTAVIAVREILRVMAARGAARPGRDAAMVAVGVVIVAAGLVEADAGLLRTLFTDASLRAIGPVLSSRSFLALSFGGCALLGLFFVWFPAIMRRIEGRLSIVDVAVSVFLVIGLAGVVVTYARNGVIVTGLNGFRYYFALAITYLPARYFMRTREQQEAFLKVLAVACLTGCAQLLLESYLLNSLRVPFQQLPWAGPLAREFGYQPEPRAFFDAPLMPVGFMYMTHVSGLFLLLGFAVAAPRLLAKDSRLSSHKLEAAVAAAAIIGGIWTSRTVLLLLVASFVIAAGLVPSTWRRRVGGALLLCALSVAGARWLIPGARYDLPSELRFLAGAALPNLAGAIAVDMREIFRWSEAPAPVAALPQGWVLHSKGTAASRSTGAGRYAIDITADDQIDLRTAVPVGMAQKGESVRAEALVRAPGVAVALQLFDGHGVINSTRTTLAGGIETLVVEATHRGMPMSFDIDVPNGARATVERVTFSSPRGTIAALGYDPPRWSPGGWRLMDPAARSERVTGLGDGAVRLSAGPHELDFRYDVPPGLLASSGQVTVTAHVDAPPGQRVGLQFVSRDRVVDESQGFGGGQPIALTVSGPLRTRDYIDIDVPSNGTAVVRDVRVQTPQGSRSLLMPIPHEIGPAPPATPVSAPASGETSRPASRPSVPAAPASAAPPAPTSPAAATSPAAEGAPTARRSETFKDLLLGHGAEFGTWNQVFFAQKSRGEFATSSYSDTKYLEFFQQFGALGLAALLSVGLAPCWVAARLWRSAATPRERAHIVGLVLMIFIGFVSLLHLPSMFKTGFGTAVFIAMAIVARLEAERVSG